MKHEIPIAYLEQLAGIRESNLRAENGKPGTARVLMLEECVREFEEAVAVLTRDREDGDERNKNVIG